MAVLKCKMCGGDLTLLEGASVCTCEYCGTQQTVPTADNEKKLNLFARANRLRFGCEFDKAAGIYEAIVADFPEEAEAYWGLVLCRYGIEYVDDPATAKKIPTCHRSSFDSVLEDDNFALVLEYADASARAVYREEAKKMESLRRGIIEVSAKEEPYDIFICYKETDATGERTLDSVIAQDVYTALTDRGYRVFFSRISLEDKLGQEYEPYIFAALHSAKIMLAFGTDYEHYNAVWVKNEWSRYLQLMAKGEPKSLIPCYKGIDAYDMPREFAKLQAQDMGKVGAMQDLLRGIEKILPRKEQAVGLSKEDALAPLLERAALFTEDEDWDSATLYYDKVLDLEPKNARAYLGKLLADLRLKKLEQLKTCSAPFEKDANYQKAYRFADEGLRSVLDNYLMMAQQHVKQQAEEQQQARLTKQYEKAQQVMAAAITAAAYYDAADRFRALGDYQDAPALAKECQTKGEQLQQGEVLRQAKERMQLDHLTAYESALMMLRTLPYEGEVVELREICREKVEAGVAQRKANQKALEEKAEREEQAFRKKKKILSIATVVGSFVMLVAIFALLFSTYFYNDKEEKYEEAYGLMNAEEYEQAAEIFDELADSYYKDAQEKADYCWEQAREQLYQKALKWEEQGYIVEAYEAYGELGGYKDSLQRMDALYETYLEMLE